MTPWLWLLLGCTPASEPDYARMAGGVTDESAAPPANDSGEEDTGEN
jgi:hypothetical protein